MFLAAFVISAVLLAGAACALCLKQEAGLAESVGESMDEKTAETVVAAADIILDTLPPLKRFALSVLLRGVFALPAP